MSDKGRILIADDEETFLLSSAELLRKEGYNCTCVRDGGEAQKQFAESEFDLLIADIRMPGNQSLELVEMLSELKTGIPVILVTGYPRIDTAIKAVRLPVVSYLTKPIDISDNLSMIQSAVDLARVHRAMDNTRKGLQGLIDNLSNVRKSAGESGQRNAEITLEHYFKIAQENLIHTLLDIQRATKMLSEKSSHRDICHLMNCPKLNSFREIMQETVLVLEKSKSAFKSKKLGDLRKRIIDALESERQRIPD